MIFLWLLRFIYDISVNTNNQLWSLCGQKEPIMVFVCLDRTIEKYLFKLFRQDSSPRKRESQKAGKLIPDRPGLKTSTKNKFQISQD